MVNADESIVLISGAQHVEVRGLSRKAKDIFFDEIDGPRRWIHGAPDIGQHHGIVKRRFAAALGLVVGEKKSLFLAQRPAQSRAVLILPQNVQAWRLQDALGVHGVIAKVFVDVAMPVIGAALGDDVHHAAHRAAKLRAVAAVHHAKFLHRLL